MRLKKLLTSALAVSLAAASVVSVVPTAFAATASPATTNIYIVGDVDLDGKVTSADSLKIQRYLNGKDTFTNIQKYLADINGDNKVNQTDVTGALEYSVGKNTANNKNAGKKVSFVKSLSFVDNNSTDFTFKNNIYSNNPFKFNAKDKLQVSTKLTVTPSNSCEKFTYTSSNTSIATVDNNGKVTFKTDGSFTKTGTVLIKATSSITKKTVSCNIVVSDFYDNIAFSFVNSSSTWSRKEFTLSDFMFLYHPTDAKFLYDDRKAHNKNKLEIHGICYGIAFMSCLLNSSDSGIKVTDFYHTDGSVVSSTPVRNIKDLTVTDVYKGSITRYKNKTLQDFLNGLYLAQKSNDLATLVGKTKNKFDGDKGIIAAVQKVENTKKPVYFGYGGGHAVVGYKVVEATVKEGDRETTYADKSYKGWKVKRLYYYDCNAPKDKDRFASFFVDKNGKIVDWRLKVSDLVCSPEKTNYLAALGVKEKPNDDKDKVYLLKDKNGNTQRFIAECSTDFVSSDYVDDEGKSINYLSVWGKAKQGFYLYRKK